MPAEGTDKKNTPVVGIMGGICSGKTIVAQFFERWGFLRIDADAAAHLLLEDPGIKEELHRLFGDDVFRDDGSVDRGTLSELVFEDREKLSCLNAVIHPGVIGVIEKRIKSSVSPVVVDAALLFETGLDSRFCTHLVFVDRPKEDRIASAVNCRGWDRRELDRREKMQAPLEEKRRKADFIIRNNGSERELEGKTRVVVERIVGE